MTTLVASTDFQQSLMICLGLYISNSFQLDKLQRDLLEIHQASEMVGLDQLEVQAENFSRLAEKTQRSSCFDQ